MDRAIVSNSFQERDIAVMGKLTGLRRLQISHGRATNAALKSLTGLKRLERLSIGGDALTDDGLIYLRELPRLTSLTLNGPSNGLHRNLGEPYRLSAPTSRRGKAGTWRYPQERA